MEKINIEEYRSYMIKLGTALFEHYRGNILSEEECIMIANSSFKTRELAMDLVAADNLSGKNYTNYCRNKKLVRLSQNKQNKNT